MLELELPSEDYLIVPLLVVEVVLVELPMAATLPLPLKLRLREGKRLGNHFSLFGNMVVGA